jgi:hypothetical protein
MGVPSLYVQHISHFSARGNPVPLRQAVPKCDEKRTLVLLYVKTIWSKVHARLDIRIHGSMEEPTANADSAMYVYVSVCKGILRQTTYPSIHATDTEFLQAALYKLTYGESNFDSRQWKNILAPSKVPKPTLRTSQPPSRTAGVSSVGESLHTDASFKKKTKTGTQ